MIWREQLAKLIQRRTGVEVPTVAPQLLVLMRERVDALHLDGPDTYIRHLEQQPAEHQEWRLLIQSVTNNLTHFFRDMEQLSTLLHVLEEMAARRVTKDPIRVWSAGCATGEEAYTLAIIGYQRTLNLQVHGSDVSQHALNVAKHGVYDAWSLRHVEPAIVQSCFSIEQNCYRVRPEIARRVHFHEHNLVRDPPLAAAGARWDVIVCRNVLIYYSPMAGGDILARFARSLTSGGALLLGASESVFRLDLPLRVELVRGRVVYFKTSEAGEANQAIVAPRSECLVSSKGRIAGSNSTPTDTVSWPPKSYVEVQPKLLAMLTEGDLDAAKELLREVVQQNAADSVACLSLGHVYLLQHDLQGARSCYQSVADKEPLVAEAHYFVGVLERRCQRLQEAFEALRRAVFLEPRFWAASYLLGATARSLGKLSVCEAEWHHTIVLLTQGQGYLPLLTHPVLHAKFIASPHRALRACQASR
jgi:chemotaxis methyl-accepting protein methylase